MPKNKIKIPQINAPHEGGIDFRKTDDDEIIASIILPNDTKGEERVSIKILPLFLKKALKLEPGERTEKINGVTAWRVPKAQWETEKSKVITFFCDSGGQIVPIKIPRKELKEDLQKYYPLLLREKNTEEQA